MDRYLLESADQCQRNWFKNVFGVNVSEVQEDIPGFQKEHIDRQVQEQRFERLSYSEFWVQLKDRPMLTLLPFLTMYLCEQEYLTLVTLRIKARNRLDCQHDLRSASSINI
ncbi:MAG: hypothetical protein ACK5H4_10600 [Lacrimispora sphenoides]